MWVSLVWVCPCPQLLGPQGLGNICLLYRYTTYLDKISIETLIEIVMATAVHVGGVRILSVGRGESFVLSTDEVVTSAVALTPKVDVVKGSTSVRVAHFTPTLIPCMSCRTHHTESLSLESDHPWKLSQSQLKL